MAEEAMDSAEQMRPEENELLAIKTFCNLEVKIRQRKATVADEIKILRQNANVLKEQLKKDLLEASPQMKCASISKADATALGLIDPKGDFGGVPPYLRIYTSNKDSAINAEVIQEAIEAITAEDIQEAEGSTVAEKVRSIILDNLRRIIRNHHEYIKLATSLPRGTTLYAIPEVSTETARRMVDLWLTERKIREKNEARRVDSDVRSALNENKSLVDAFFSRTGLTAQRIVVEGTPYRLVKRISVRRPKMTLTKVEPLLDMALAKIKTFKEFRPSDIIRDLQIEISNIAPECKSNIVLCAVREAKE